MGVGEHPGRAALLGVGSTTKPRPGGAFFLVGVNFNTMFDQGRGWWYLYPMTRRPTWGLWSQGGKVILTTDTSAELDILCDLFGVGEPKEGLQSEQRDPDPAWTGEQRLLIRLLVDAVEGWRAGQVDAIDWINSNLPITRDEGFSFSDVCDHLGVRLEELHEAIASGDFSEATCHRLLLGIAARGDRRQT